MEILFLRLLIGCLLAPFFLVSSAIAQSFNGTMTGTWWDPARSGEGQFIAFERIGKRLVATVAYFTYDEAGNADWLVGSVDYADGDTQLVIPMVRGTGPRFGVGFDANDVVTQPAGNVTLGFISCSRIEFGFEGGGHDFAFEIVRLVGPLNGEPCGGGAAGPAATKLVGSLSGGWWVPSRGGEGQFISFETAGNRRIAVLFYFTYGEGGRATWMVGSTDYERNADRVEIPLISGSGARFGDAFDTADVVTVPAGRALIEIDSCTAIRFRYTGNVTFGLNLEPLVGPLVGTPCTLEELEATQLDKQLRSLIRQEGLTGDPSIGRELPGIDAPLARLGKLLFFSKTLGAEQEVACASCHHPALAGADGLAIPIGTGALDPDVVGPGRELPGNDFGVGRNSNTFFNTGLFDKGLFWDSRIESLKGTPGMNGADGGIRTPDTALGNADPGAGPNLVVAQARFPVTEPTEMRGAGLPGMSNQQVRRHLAARIGDYGVGTNVFPPSQWLERFQEAFDSEAGAEELITFENIVLAIGEYERSAVFVETPWARYVRGNLAAISTEAKQGALTFFRDTDEGGTQCVQCHEGDFFTDERHRVVGFPQVGPGKGDGEGSDFGRELQSGVAMERRAFRTPSLLNVALTAPYGHAGAYPSLGRTVNHYIVPDNVVRTFLLQRLWCSIPPFNAISGCRDDISRVQFNSLAALESMEAFRATDPENGMPVVNLDEISPDDAARVSDFLETLTDPCLLDRECFGRWIPAPDEAPDDFQLNALDGDGNPL